MDIVYQSRLEPIYVPRNRVMGAVWLFASLLLCGFGLLPWILWLAKGNGFNWMAAGVLTIWSAIPISIGLHLIFSSLCRIEISANGTEICTRKYIGLISFHKRFVADHIQLGTHVVWGKRERQNQVLFLYKGLKQRQILLWDQECRDLPSVGKTVALAGGLKYTEK